VLLLLFQTSVCYVRSVKKKAVVHGLDESVSYLLQALSILRGVGVGSVVQLTVSKCSAPAGVDVSDSDSSTPVNTSVNDIVSVATASVPPGNNNNNNNNNKRICIV